mgnify:CR=1 FL=1
MKNLEVGNKINIKNPSFLVNYKVKVIRVTETKAVARTPFNTIIEFKRSYTHSSMIILFKPIHWDTTYYKLIE